jgi:type IV pilus assembly protein PilX
MNRHALHLNSRQRGMALISALLLLLVITILGVGMFRSIGTQERIAGNTREKQRAVHAAGSAQAYAEWWLSSAGGINASGGVQCTGKVSADTGNAQVCSNQIRDAVGNVSLVPWKLGGTGSEVAVTYTPPGLATTGPSNTYYDLPRFYISFVTGAYDAVSGAQTNTYQIDALGYGGTPTAVAVVESGYKVGKMYTTRGDQSKFINLGGP